MLVLALSILFSGRFVDQRPVVVTPKPNRARGRFRAEFKTNCITGDGRSPGYENLG
ncbi:hypothetical protein MCOR25_010938 [Pyricularia grisea]|nr:hypothetical protein MCOR25_010938 [Pyricularia grisea]